MSQPETASDIPVILVIDDEKVIRLLARGALSAAGYDIVEAEDGNAGLELLENCSPDLALLDVVMPNLDGFAVCSAIRRSTRGRHIPVLIMTGLDDVESVDQAYDVGATDFITKPINWAILRYRVRYLLGAAQSIRRVRHSEAKVRGLINAIPDTLLRIQSDGTLFSCTPGKEQAIANISQAASAGTEQPQLTDELVALIGEKFDLTLVDGSVQVFEYSQWRGEEERHWEIRLVRSADSEAVALIRDFTERKRVDRELRQLSRVVEQSPTSILITDTAGNMQYVNPRLCELTGYRRDELIGQNPRIYLAYYDKLTGLPNRTLFREKVEDALAYSRRSGESVVLLDLDDFKRINDTLGHRAGDLLLRYVAEHIQGCVRASDIQARLDPDDNTQIARMGGDEFALCLSRAVNSQDAIMAGRRILTELSRTFSIDGREVFISGSMGVAVYPQDGENVDTGLIETLGEWVLRAACEQGRLWQAAGLPKIRLAVNVSGYQLRRQRLVGVVRKIIEDCAMEAQDLELELTESSIMSDTRAAKSCIYALKNYGIRIAVDDFGTGYSSLGYLRSFPLDVLKMDKSFVDGVAETPDDAALATAIINMSHSLGLEVVAEGVETEDQLEFLRHQRCDTIQGYVIAEPLSPERFAQCAMARFANTGSPSGA
jgi:diguanylate cyclase (GGDEF)-like protein